MKKKDNNTTLPLGDKSTRGAKPKLQDTPKVLHERAIRRKSYHKNKEKNRLKKKAALLGTEQRSKACTSIGELPIDSRSTKVDSVKETIETREDLSATAMDEVSEVDDKEVEKPLNLSFLLHENLEMVMDKSLSSNSLRLSAKRLTALG